MASPSKVTDTDKGLKALLRRLKQERWTLTVGVHGAQGTETHREPAPETKAPGKGTEGPANAPQEGASRGPVTVLDVAIWNEYGTGRIPERSFIRDWADENEARHQSNLRTIAEAVLKGKYDIRTGLERLGLLFVGEVQRRISAGIPPANAPSTIAKKGSSTPLINFGQLRSSVLHRVKKGDDGS